VAVVVVAVAVEVAESELLVIRSKNKYEPELKYNK
jgi:hypothetical protein